MAESVEQTDKQKVYAYDADKTSHPLIQEEDLPKDQPLQANQTTVTPNNGANYWNGTSWVDQLVVVYEFDPTKDNVYTGTSYIPQGAVLASNQTFVKPADGLYQPMRFNGTTWIGTPKEEWETAHPAPKMEPSASQIAQANTLKDVAQLQVAHTNQQKLNADLMKDNASLKKQNQTQLTVNATLMKQVAVLQKQIKALTPATTTAQ